VNTRDLLKELVQLGGEWHQKQGTGEIVCSHPDYREKVRLSHWKRRKDAPRKLASMLASLRRSALGNGQAAGTPAGASGGLE
jgi:hypothetical protein